MEARLIYKHNGAFFDSCIFCLNPARLLPALDGVLIPLRGSSGRLLRCPTALPHDAACMRWVVGHPESRLMTS